MPRSVAQARFHKDRELRRVYYRPFIKAGVLFVLCALMGISLAALYQFRMWKEWHGVPVQQAEATCVRSKPYIGQKTYWWESTYLIRGTRYISQGPEGCVAGKEYALLYQIGHSGRLAVISRKLLMR